MWLPPVIPALGRLKTAAGGLPRIPRQPGAQGEFQGSLGVQGEFQGNLGYIVSSRAARGTE